MNRLHNKVAIVTGAASGIGKAITALFLKEGAKVVATDKQVKQLELMATEFGNYHLQLMFKYVDLNNGAEIEELVDDAISHFGGLDILVNNAGIMDHFESVAELSNETWHQIMKVNLEAPFRLMRKSLGFFLTRQSGNIINIASIGGIQAGRAGAAYTTSKFGLIGLTKNTGYLYAKSGIRCNAIAPGAVKTNITDRIDFEAISPLANERIMGGVSMNPRIAEPEEIASIALFLATDDSKFINAATVVADGGWIAY